MRIACVIFFGIFLATASRAELVTKVDRFDGTVAVHTKPDAPANGAQPHIRLVMAKESDGSSPVLFGFVSANASWQYLSCHFVKLLVDGKPYDLGEFSHEGTVGDGYVLEYINVIVSSDKYRVLANAQKIEYKICNDEYTVTTSQMADIRALPSTFAKALATK